ncbi:MAG: MFS transporter [Pseudomonadales bacterium]|nr:MFS transporter [Pseudomonadales bacterium]MBO6594776.1 MFS transporter [Pseudomonadales bacterium]MBO6821664.1 MFS transporter [Pseudomonadales bacterium]
MNAEQFKALRHKQFRNYWLGSFTSVGATQLQVMGLAWLVYELSESALMLGYLGAAMGFPAVLTTLFGGALADRVNKRRLLEATSILTFLLLALLSWLDWSGQVTAWHAIAIAAGISIITGFDWPARQAIFPALIEREDMMSAVALTTVIWQATRMVMPTLGGVVIALTDTWVLFMLCSLGFFFMYLVLINLEVKAGPVAAPQSTLQQIREGITFILTTRTFYVLLGLSYAVFFFGMIYMQLMPAFIDMLGVGERGYGYMLSVTGLGAVTGTAISGTLQRSHRLGLSMLLSAATFCLFIYLFAAVSYISFGGAYFVALLIIFAAALFSSVFMVTSTTVLQLEVPDELRGRVMGFHAITYNLAPLGALMGGAIAEVTNPSIAVSIMISLLLCLILWILVTQESIRKIDGQLLTSST